MYININNSETYKKATQVEVGGITYPKSIFGDTEKLNSLGIYKLTEDAIPNRRYYTYNEVVNVEARNIDRTPIARDIDAVKQTMINDCKQAFLKYSTRPRVFTSFGFDVDGSKDDIINLEIGLELGVDFIKDADGVVHQVTKEQFEKIILELKQNGLYLYQKKWEKETEIQSLQMIEDVILFEATPYEYIITESDISIDIESDLKIGDIVTRYKNNTVEWF